MSKVSCKKCGNKISNEEKNCSDCGAALTEKSSRNFWLFLIVFLTFVVGPFFVVDFNPAKSPEERAILQEQIEAENRRSGFNVP